MGISCQNRGPPKPTDWHPLALAIVLRYATPAGQGKTKPAPQPGLSGVHFKQSTGSLLLRLAGSLFRAIHTDNITNDDCKYILDYGILAAPPPGLIYYSETVALYKEYWNEIWDIVLEDDITIQDCIREQDLRSATQFANHMVWAATEKLAFERLFNPKKIEYRRTTKW